MDLPGDNGILWVLIAASTRASELLDSESGDESFIVEEVNDAPPHLANP